MISREQSMIREVFAPLAEGAEGAFGLRDDAALLAAGEGRQLVITKDALVGGIHFLPDDPPDLVARKALRVNLSDLAAKAAQPESYLLALSLPEEIGPEWVKGFAAGLEQDQAEFGCRLIGGDTTHTKGPVVVSITAIGSVPEGGMKLRSQARVGELVYVTGTIGDGWLGLKARQGETWDGVLSEDDASFLRDRYLVPRPRVDFVSSLRKHVSAALDVSDGLAGDLELMCDASGVSAEVDLTQVGLSAPARALMDNGIVTLVDLMSGGDDYELLVTVTPNSVYAFEGAARRLSAPVSRIGRIVAGAEPPRFYGGEGETVLFEQASYSHMR